MARGVGRTGSGRPVFSELQHNGEPPRSTLAAQLVNHFTDGKKHSRNQDQETFRQLLQEVLGSEDEQHPRTEAIETDSAVNYKLIYVIFKAGLEVLDSEDPFGKQDERYKQAVDSLAAIELTIRRNPEVLFAAPSSQENDPRLKGPLFLWLISELLSLTGKTHDRGITNCVIQLLKTSLINEKKVHSKGGKLNLVLKYLKGCIKDLLSCIEAAVFVGARTHGMPQAVMPSAMTIAEVCPNHVQDRELQGAVEIRYRDSTQVNKMAISAILAIVTCNDLEPVGKNLMASASGWMLSNLTRYWHAVVPGSGQLSHNHVSISWLPLFLEGLTTVLSPMTAIKVPSAILDRSVILSSQVLTTLLRARLFPLDSVTERAICIMLFHFASLVQKSQHIRPNFIGRVLPDHNDAQESRSHSADFSEDLKHAIALTSRMVITDNQSPTLLPPHAEISSFQDAELEQTYHKFLSNSRIGTANKDAERPSKRARYSIVNEQDTNGDVRPNILASIHDLLGFEEDNRQGSLGQIPVEIYNKLPEEQQCALYTCIGILACASASGASSPHDRCSLQFKCYICDAESRDSSRSTSSIGPELEEGFSVLARLINMPRIQKYRRPRVAAMLALKRLLSHTSNIDYLDLATSPFGQWCLQVLHSSVRELRVAAGRTLPVFLQDITDTEISLRNRKVALDVLRKLSEQSDLALQETCVLAWGQVARVSDGDEMNLVLLKLVEYLGHTNALLSGLAFDEIQMISNHSPFSAMKLFAPYWPTIAVTVVQDLQRRPQIAQQLSDLLAVSVADFLSMTQLYTVPFFVLTKKKDILQRIADASGQSIMVLCREHNNLAAILSCILLRTSSDVEGLVMNLLNAVSPEFGNVDCAELLKSEPQATASELLRAAGESGELKRAKAHQALHFLAQITHGKSVSGRGSARKMDTIGPFFETHVLGIMALLADTINDGKGPQPVLEKIRCLGAIREMIKVARSHVSNGLPQICACLRSAIENKDLVNQGFDAWIFMMISLGEDEIATLLDPTFALLVQYWESLRPEIQNRAHDMISYILKTFSYLIRESVHTLPSLATIPLMSKFEEELGKLKAQMDVKHHFQAFSRRCQNENGTVVLTALNELSDYLEQHQAFLHEAANSEQPDPVVSQLARSILDTSVHFCSVNLEITVLCAKCMGLIGCLDSTRVEAAREKREILVLSNFVRDDETNDFVIFFLREVLVKAFLSATNSRSQGFLAYAMQELLSISGIRESVTPRSRDGPFDANYRRWVSLPESVRATLMPFTDSKYFVTAGVSQPPCVYPLYKAEMGHGQWLRTLTFDLLKKKAGASKIQTIFSVLSRIIRFQDISISNFLLPFACLNVIISGTEREKLEIGSELLLVLRQSLSTETQSRDSIIQCSQTVFQALDYLSRWMQEKKKEVANSTNPGTKAARLASEADVVRALAEIQSVETVLAVIPADIMSRRAVECKSYSRALFHWEQFIRQKRERSNTSHSEEDVEPLYERLQEIYTQIDEPDGIEGISTHLQVLNIDQQILEHRKAGRWTAAQSWYELLLTEKPTDLDVQYNLLTSLKESGQYDVLLNQVDGFQRSDASRTLALPFAVEASWVTGKWGKLRTYLSSTSDSAEADFNVGLGRALLALSEDRVEEFSRLLDRLRQNTARGLSVTNTTSLQGCHEFLLRFHVLTEIEMISGIRSRLNGDKSSLLASLGQRLDVLGPFHSDKQYLLGLRRATMQLSSREFSNIDLASAWLTSAKLARKGNFTHQAFNAVLHASQLGDESATIEHSRLLWKEGNHRKAIQSLEGAINANAFRSYDYTEAEESMNANNAGRQQQQNMLKARAHLLLAKWIDRAGQTQSDVTISQYRKAVQYHVRSEKAHYYLGKHYNKLLESEKSKQPMKQIPTFVTGEIAKLVVDNYGRSLQYGAKYIYQTMPRLLTLWLDLGSAIEEPLDARYHLNDEGRTRTIASRRKMLEQCNSQVRKIIDRLPAFTFYTALSQIMARICHPNHAVYGLLVDIVVKVVIQHAPQALWTLLAVVKSSTKDRATRGASCMARIGEHAKKAKTDSSASELKTLLQQGQKLSDQLLHVCEGDIPGKATHVSLTRDLGFNHKTASCKLAMPLEISLTARLPTMTENVNMKLHKPFSSRDYIHISTFLDDVLVLSSLQRPRKISIRGSDGHVYALLCKPKDDLRKDQRLMEFNAMINRALKKDAESSKRRLYIKTYAVTPLNEECGLIEWIDNLKTLREILLNSYKQKNVHINYVELRQLLNESVSAPEKLPIFTKKIIPHFHPVFHEWFVEMFPEPGAWFAARLRYTRSCAVMSIVGHVLGLGDRHGENILFEEGNGGTFHVDFNCLFDKGLTFEKPELVPFRLTHNMVDAFGAYGYEGPFRKSCELTLGILRQNEDTLMTILETFLYDPTTDFIGKKKKVVTIVPDTPEGVLESVRNKVRGLLPLESVPLSVEGYVQALIQQATDPFKLASMYIGWCAFF